MQGELIAPNLHQTLPEEPYDTNDVIIRDSQFTWSSEGSDTPSRDAPSRRAFRLQIEEEVKFHSGCLNLITGPTGSGKTSLLMSLLGEFSFDPSSWFLVDTAQGEMVHSPLSSRSLVQLPRDGGLAYAAQESWVMNETIRVHAGSLRYGDISLSNG
jgi:ABC-type uncharacterized transport system fused permease/ATPase subunit